MSDKITCPSCQCEIEVTEVMSAQLSAKLRDELEAEHAEKTRKLASDRNELIKREEQLASQKAELDQQVKEAVAKEKEKIVAAAQVEAQQVVAVEIADRDEQLTTAKTKLKEFESQELALRKQARELEEKAEQQELEVARQIDEERKQIRTATLKQAQEQNELKQAEKDEIIKGLLKQVDEMKRKAEQGSQQTQGEVQELALENMLETEFPGDVIKPVGKGVKGGDVVHHVFDQNGRECGAILWESKRTKAWSDKWLSKAIDDQQEAKATCACIVTATMPVSVEHLGEINGVWVASWPCARSAAIALRRVLIEAAQARQATEGQHGKMELVYNYLSGPEFRNRIRGLIEPFVEMQKDLETEKRSLQRLWNKRQKQLDRALGSTSGLYGDLQGIIGSNLQEIEGMDILAIESSENGEKVETTAEALGETL